MHSTIKSDVVVVADVEVSPDGMTVTLKCSETPDRGVAPEDLAAQLTGMGILVPDPQLIASHADPDGKIRAHADILLLEGTRPIHGKPSWLEILVTPPDPNLKLSHYERMAYLTARPGQVIAKIHPALKGTDGIDVFGKPASHMKAQSPVFDLGKNVALDPDGMIIRATTLGRINHEGYSLWVEDALEVPGNVDFASGNVDVSGDVHIRRGVLDLFKVKGANVFVGGTVKGAEIITNGNLHVNGGIVGKEKGHCSATGDISCKYSTNATLIAGGNVVVNGTVSNSNIACTGRLAVDRGPLMSAHVTANGGVSCQSLGTPTSEKIFVEAGIDDALRQLAKSKLHIVLARRKKAADMHTNVEQMLKQMRNPTPTQKQQSTDMLNEALAAEKEADEMLRALRQAYDASRAKRCPEVVVQNVVHAGASIRFPGVETTIETDWQGPLRLIPSKTGEEWEILLIDLTTNSKQVLPSHACTDPIMTALEKAMEETRPQPRHSSD